MVTYDIKDDYCSCGALWIRVESSILFGDYYYCNKCDKIYVQTVKEKTPEWFEEQYDSNRRQELIDRANLKNAKRKVTPADLRKLGYL